MRGAAGNSGNLLAIVVSLKTEHLAVIELVGSQILASPMLLRVGCSRSYSGGSFVGLITFEEGVDFGGGDAGGEGDL